MKVEDGDKFRDLMRGMARVFGAEADSLMLDAYWLALKSWSIEDFESAVGELLQTAKFMPKPADFNELRKASRLAAGEAFAKAMSIARDLHPDRCNNVSSGDGLIDAAVHACGGWRALAMSDTDKAHFLEKRFTEHFDAISDREETREHVPALAGPPRHDMNKLLSYMTKSKRLD